MSALRRTAVSLLAAAALLFAPSPAPPFAAAPARITLDDVVALLKAGAGESLILREIGTGALAFEIGVQETLRLKQAGASDQFIESLMGEPDAGESEPASSYRVVKEMTADGREILHVTNLDPSGRRMGGELRHASDAVAPRPGSAAQYRPADEAPPAPVIVNVYPAPPQATGYDDGYTSPYMYRDPYASSYPGGILPGYYPFFDGANRYAGIGFGGNRGRCEGPGRGLHPGVSPPDPRSMETPRRFAGPTYSPIGPATGYDMYHQHTQGAVRR